MDRSCVYRQVFVQTGLMICSISEGLGVGHLSGMVAALRSKDSDVTLSNEEISWIASMFGATSIIGLGIAAFMSTRCGRRNAIIILNIPTILTWIMVYYAASLKAFIICRALGGIFGGGILIMLFITTAEYACSNRRSLCLYIVTSVGVTFGVSLGHILCVLLHWRIVALISIIPAVMSSILPYFWVESPPWLASKGRFEESETAFRALHGHTISANKELDALISFEKGKQHKERTKDDNCMTVLYSFLRLFTKKSFWNLCFLSIATIVYRTAAGKFYFSTLAITMLQDLTGSTDILLFTIVVDGFFLLGTCISCFLISKMKMRTLLFSASIISNILLLALTAIIYFNVEHSVTLSWTKCVLLALYFITINAGPYPVVDSLIGEVFPLELKGYYTFLFGIVATAALFLNIKLAFDIVAVLGYDGMFLLNTVLTVGSLVYMWFRLPETKGRTLQDIEYFFENNTFDKVDKLKKDTTATELVKLTLIKCEQ